eukprot:SAG31_NODE_27369_length_427_cov_0.725610_1_plen_31_part_01
MIAGILCKQLYVLNLVHLPIEVLPYEQTIRS